MLNLPVHLDKEKDREFRENILVSFRKVPPPHPWWISSSGLNRFVLIHSVECGGVFETTFLGRFSVGHRSCIRPDEQNKYKKKKKKKETY